VKILDQVTECCRVKNYSPNTAKTYRKWAEDFLRWVRRERGEWVHPLQLDAEDVEAFLTHLATQKYLHCTRPASLSVVSPLERIA